jgi:hypothetical protein
MRVLMLAALSAALAASSGSPADAQTASFIGRWHWDKAQSSSVPGEPAPRDIQLNITALSLGALAWTLNEVDPQGGKHSESFNGKPDGTAFPVVGAGDQTTAAFTLAGNTLKAMFKSQDGATDSWSCAETPDGGKMKCQGTESDGKGHTAGYTDVYDRM